MSDPRGSVINIPLDALTNRDSRTSTHAPPSSNSSRPLPIAPHEPPPPYAPQHPEPDRGNNTDDDALPPSSATRPLYNDFDFNGIPTLPNSNYSGSERYVWQMNLSLCFLVYCLLICNPLSLFFTLPSVICAWKSVNVSMTSNFRLARKFAKASKVLIVITFIQYACLIIIAAIIVIIYVLLQNDLFQIKGIHY